MAYGDENLPAGAAEDPRAPWKQKPALHCHACGHEPDDDIEPGDTCHWSNHHLEPCPGHYREES